MTYQPPIANSNVEYVLATREKGIGVRPPELVVELERVRVRLLGEDPLRAISAAVCLVAVSEARSAFVATDTKFVPVNLASVADDVVKYVHDNGQLSATVWMADRYGVGQWVFPYESSGSLEENTLKWERWLEMPEGDDHLDPDPGGEIAEGLKRLILADQMPADFQEEGVAELRERNSRLKGYDSDALVLVTALSTGMHLADIGEAHVAIKPNTDADAEVAAQVRELLTNAMTAAELGDPRMN